MSCQFLRNKLPGWKYTPFPAGTKKALMSSGLICRHKKDNKWDSTASVFLHRPQRCSFPGRRQREHRLSLKVQVCLSSKFFVCNFYGSQNALGREISMNLLSVLVQPTCYYRRLNPTRPKELSPVRVVIAHPQIDFSAKSCLKTWKDESRICGTIGNRRKLWSTFWMIFICILWHRSEPCGKESYDVIPNDPTHLTTWPTDQYDPPDHLTNLPAR